MAGFNLARKRPRNEKQQQFPNHLKNVTALNQRTTSDTGSNNEPVEGFDLIGTSGVTYNLEEITESKNRESTVSPLVIQNQIEENTESSGGLSITTDDSKKVIPTNADYKKYLLD